MLGFKLVNQIGASLAFFDSASPASIKQAIAFNGTPGPACEKAGSLKTEIRDLEAPHESYLLGQNGSNFITRNIFDDGHPEYRIKAGDAFQYCYFFKKIR